MTKKSRVIFVVGNSRSGTTMTARILGNHNKVFMFKELHFFGELWSEKDKNKIASHDKKLSVAKRLVCSQMKGYWFKCGANEYKQHVNDILAKCDSECTLADIYKAFLFYFTEKEGKEIPCEQTPRNVFYLGDIFAFFPEAKVVNLVRDPRDVLLSQKRKWKRRFLGRETVPLWETIRTKINYHPFTISKLWNASIKAAGLYNTDKRVKTVYFEKLAKAPEEEVRKLCDFLEIDFQEKMLQIPVVGSSNEKDNPNRLGIDKSKIGSWRNGGLSNTEIYVLQKICGKLMKEHGYDLVDIKPNPFALVFYFLVFPVHLTLAFVFNLKRMKNVWENIKKRLS